MKEGCILLMIGLLVAPLPVWGRKGYGNYAFVPGLGGFGTEYSYAPNSIPDDSLPNPILSDHPEWVDLYWKAWHIAKTKIQYGTPQNGFVDEYMDEGFNPNIFQWDSCFMMMFARYGYNVFPSIITLHNFYRKQHVNGFICREIRESDGSDYWSETDPSATNPPLFAWAEWEHYRVTADTLRLDTVLQHLTDYYQWIKSNRNRANGLYWWSNLASGMDNSPRGIGAYTWIDYSAQQALAALYISKIAQVIGDDTTRTEYENEYIDLKALINDELWDQGDGMYYDLASNGSFFKVKTPASFWPILTELSDSVQAARLFAHLTDTLEFWRTHVFPTLSADHPGYNPRGGYWLGSVWAPTNYEIIKGLQRYGYEDLAKLSSENHIENMSQVYINYVPHTIWENYAPDYVRPGSQSRGDFVGWSGCGPIALLIENVLGFRVDGPNDSLF
jgi:glycogen debranching enzyme